MSFIHLTEEDWKNKHLSSAPVWIQFLRFSSRIQQLWPLVAIGFWEVTEPSLTLQVLKRKLGVYSINLNKIGTKIQVSWFSKRRQASASHLLGLSHALRALPVSHLLSSASAKPTPRNSQRGLVFRQSLFQITTPTYLLDFLGQIAWSLCASISLSVEWA